MEPRIQYAKTSDGVRIACCATGEGVPLVLLQGLPGHLQLDWEIFREAYESFSQRGYRLIRLDFAGSGLSDHAGVLSFEMLSFEKYALSIEAVAARQANRREAPGRRRPRRLHLRTPGDRGRGRLRPLRRRRWPPPPPRPPRRRRHPRRQQRLRRRRQHRLTHQRPLGVRRGARLGHRTLAGAHVGGRDVRGPRRAGAQGGEREGEGVGGARGWRVMEPRIQYAKASDGVSIAYTVLGTGPLIVFPSNIWGSLHLFRNEAFDLATSYFNQLVSLGWSVITYDGRGTGASDRNTGDWNLEARLRDLNAVLDRTAPDRFALCGEAQGGPAAISYAVENPKRVSHLVLSNTFAAGSDWYGVIPAFRTSQLMLRDAEEDLAFAMLSLANAVTGYANSERARALAEIFRTGIRPRDFVAYRDAAEKMDVRDLLSQISVPTMVMYDRTWILDGVGILAHRLAPLIPNARLVETTEPV